MQIYIFVNVSIYFIFSFACLSLFETRASLFSFKHVINVEFLKKKKKKNRKKINDLPNYIYYNKPARKIFKWMAKKVIIRYCWSFNI